MPPKNKSSVAYVEEANCYLCGQAKPATIYLRDKAGNHRVCKECADTWAESDEEWARKARPQPRAWADTLE